MKQTVFKTGNSLAVTIPSDFVEIMGIKAGDKIKSRPQPDKGKIVYIFSQSLQLPLPNEIIKKSRLKS